MRSFAAPSIVFLLSAVFFALVPADARAGIFIASSDLIQDSAPLATTTHTITFTASTTIPLGGKIRLVFEAEGGSSFGFPFDLDFTDMDLSVATSSGFVDRDLGNTIASVTEDYVEVDLSGISPIVTVTLGDAEWGAIPAGATIRFKIGDHATYGTLGDRTIQNPPQPGSYRIRLTSLTAGDVVIDYGAAMIAVVLPVTMGPVDTTDSVPPTRYDGRPSGELLWNTTALQISLRTDKLATCRFDVTPGLDYQDMLYATMTSANIGLLHYYTLTSLTASTSYTFYVRCMNNSRYVNTDDFPISFSLGPPLSIGSSTPAPPPPPPAPSSFSGPGPAGGPYLPTGDVTLDGSTFPSARVFYLRDGKLEGEGTADATGHFNRTFSQLERGTYTWGVYAQDPTAKNSGTYNSVTFINARTNNIVAPIYLSPTVNATSSIELGTDLTIEGYAIPRLPVRVVMNRRDAPASGQILTATTTADNAGRYRLTLRSSTLEKGTYEVKAQTIVSEKDQSLFSPPHFVGVGEAVTLDFGNRSDLNKDGRVNLVDFSILLFHWRTSDPVADINQDGTVNLTDFSIMLANWTG
jgi:hypothetical protein